MPHSFRLSDIAANTLEDTEARLEGLKSKYLSVGLVLHLHPNDLRPGKALNSTYLPDYRIPSARLIGLCGEVYIHLSDGRLWLDKSITEDGGRFVDPNE